MRSIASRELESSGLRWTRGLMVAMGSAGSRGLIQGRCLSFFFTAFKIGWRREECEAEDVFIGEIWAGMISTKN
ncbi:hypothetical protein EJ110_NYTH42094 [Nymphaea thermarum]|nr:hypothetical protein EJ110_NYTH42094 [Nymphaea thermarum]